MTAKNVCVRAVRCCSTRLAGSPPTARAARRNLEYELKRQIYCLMAGISPRTTGCDQRTLARSSAAASEYANGTGSPPKALIEAVERMLPALRFFHGIGMAA